MNKLLNLVLILFLFAACEKYSPEMRVALKLSGNNKGQLEKVLQHYSAPSDSLKFKAACFLIENMPGHYTLRGDKIDRCREIINSDMSCSYYNKKFYDIILDYFIEQDQNARREDDITSITADFLIRHIDATFELAQKQRLLEIIPFNVFLEHVLPYRFRHERLDLWRDSLQVKSKNKPLGELAFSFASLKSNFELKTPRDILKKLSNSSKLFSHGLLRENMTTDCFYLACYTMWEYRSLGLPQIIDCIPFYSNRNGYHYWCTTPPILYKETNVTGAFDRRSAKVYRHTFSRNPTITPINGEYIPEFFQDPFLQDVTDTYYYTTNIEIEGNIPDSLSHVFLCVFNNLQWKPIAAGMVVNDKAKFHQLAKNIVYLPVYYVSSGFPSSFSYPFILDIRGEMKFLVPNKRDTQTLHIERKNPDARNVLFSYMKSLDGIVIEASDFKNFSQKDTVFILQESGKLFYESSNIYPDKEYRWYRVKSGNYRHIAELYFIDSYGEMIQGKVDSLKWAAIDGDPLTNITLYDDFIIDFESSVAIDKIVCLPRNDGNGVYPNNVYELFYYDLDGWKSMGRQEGNKFYVEYENVPKNALYWLRNLTTGVEERIFTYENGQITFW